MEFLFNLNTQLFIFCIWSFFFDGLHPAPSSSMVEVWEQQEHVCSLAPPPHWGRVLQALCFFFVLLFGKEKEGKKKNIFLQSRLSCGSSSNVHHF